MDDAEADERNPPGLEHGAGDARAALLGRAGKFEQFLALQPVHREEARSR